MPVQDNDVYCQEFYVALELQTGTEMLTFGELIVKQSRMGQLQYQIDYTTETLLLVQSCFLMDTKIMIVM